MIRLAVPTGRGVAALASVVGYVTEGLDVEILDKDYVLGRVVFDLVGTEEDVQLARERAIQLGGEVL